MHKAKDIDLRDQLNEEDISLRRALEADNQVGHRLFQYLRSRRTDVAVSVQPKGPIIERKEAPKELAQRGSELAEAMDELAMAFK